MTPSVGGAEGDEAILSHSQAISSERITL
jgi:hypothetical protein